MEQINESPLAGWRRYLSQGTLAYQVDLTTGEAVFFPRVVAPVSGSTRLEWRESAGQGSVYSTTTVYRKNEAPLNVALIQLDEGFRLMSRVEGIDADAVKIGMRVRVSIREDADGVPYPVFEPADTSAEGGVR
jgi:uncharacterized OB-fold protein